MKRGRERNSRQLHIDPPWGILPIIKRGVMIQLQARLHAIKVLKLDECETAAFGRFFLFGSDTDRDRGVFGEVVFDRFGVGGVGEVSFPISMVRA